MKKYLPLMFLAAGVLVVIGAYLFVSKNKGNEESLGGEDEVLLSDVPLSKRPVVSLTPTTDGHYLQLKVDKIVIDADTFDYMLEYKTENGLLQGVPGVADLKGKNSFETDLLLGTESSGKFRYDEGVETGSIEIKFRKAGKLVAKFKTDFKMEPQDKGYKISMNTIGGASEGEISEFSSN